MQKESFYFPHFCNARHDRKIQRMRSQLGVEGYGIYFMLLEVLREQHDLCYPMDDIDLLALEFHTSEQKIRTVVCNYQLFDIDDDNKFFSPKMLVYLEPYFRAKQQRIEAGKASALKRIANDRSTTVDTTVQQSKVKESKVNEIKVKESKEDILERKNKFLLELQSFSDLLNSEFDSFFSYWTEPDSKGNMRFEKEKFFDIRRRITTWMSRSKTYDKSNQGRLQQMISQKDSVINLLNQAYGTGNDQ